MRVIATIQADLEVTPLGTRSRLSRAYEGRPMLRRTVERIGLAKQVHAIYVFCPAGQYERCEAILKDTNATIQRYEADPPPWRSLVQAARKWSLDGWRGGIGGTTHFDEYTDVRLLNELLEAVDVEAVLSIPPAAPLVDPALADRMIEHHRGTADDVRMTFTQAPPGLAGLLLDVSLIRELAEKCVGRLTSNRFSVKHWIA